MHFNAITLVGTAASNPEVRYFESGAVRGRTGLTVSIEKLDLPANLVRDSDQPPAPDLLVEVETWGRRAELMAESIRVGQTFGVSGRLMPSAETGTLRVLADHLSFP